MIELDSSSLYEQRIVVLLEDDCGSNTYNQVILDGEQFKIISNAIGKPTGKVLDNDIQEVEIKTVEEKIKLPENLKSHY